MDPVYIALVIAVLSSLTAIITPIVVAQVSNASRRQDKLENWQREDDMRAQMAVDAKRLLDSSERIVSATEAANGKIDTVRDLSEKTYELGEKTHGLVNSDKTARMQSELAQTRVSLIALKEVLALHAAAGRQPSPEAQTAIALTQAKVNELEAEIADRLKQQASIDAQTAQAELEGNEP